jgi:hypothetical protein
MIGRKNIVFGFLYLVLTAALGPYMIQNYFGDFQAAQGERQAVLARLAQIKTDGFEENLEPLTADQIAKLNAEALLAINKEANAGAPIDNVKGGPHAHGNLEALLNIAAGVVLCFIGLAPIIKQVISWVFIAGALLHSGALYLATFGVGLGGTILNTGIGPILVLAGLLLAGIAAAIGFKGELVRDA